MARRKILIVDDTPVVRQTLCSILTDEGFDADTAANGAVALGMLSRKEYDLLLTDIMMPVMNGIELYQHVKEEHPEYSSKVIFMSAGIDAGMYRLFPGADRPFLEKGFTVDELIAAAGWI